MFIEWEKLDRCRSSLGLAAVLYSYGIKGIPKNTSRCPLAKATGWSVTSCCRYSKHPIDYTAKLEYLTPAECAFVEEFDMGKYPELESGFKARIREFKRFLFS